MEMNHQVHWPKCIRRRGLPRQTDRNQLTLALMNHPAVGLRAAFFCISVINMKILRTTSRMCCPFCIYSLSWISDCHLPLPIPHPVLCSLIPFYPISTSPTPPGSLPIPISLALRYFLTSSPNPHPVRSPFVPYTSEPTVHCLLSLYSFSLPFF